MSLLGIPYRLIYRTQGAQPNVDMISLQIMRSGEVNPLPPVAMHQFPAPFTGRYYYDYVSSLSDPEGEYIAFVSSPLEDVYQEVKFTLNKPWSTMASLLNLQADVDANQTATLAAINIVEGLIEECAQGADMATLLSRLTNTRANLMDRLANLDTSVNSRVATTDPRLSFLDSSIGAIAAGSAAEDIGSSIMTIEIEDIESTTGIEIDTDDSSESFDIEVMDPEE